MRFFLAEPLLNTSHLPNAKMIYLPVSKMVQSTKKNWFSAVFFLWFVYHLSTVPTHQARSARWRKTEATEPNQAASLNISGVVGVLVMEKYVNESWVYGSTKKTGYIGCFRRVWHPYQHIGTTMNKILWGCLWTKQHFKIHLFCEPLGSFQSQLAFHPTKPRS